jgi:hypothetical protein
MQGFFFARALPGTNTTALAVVVIYTYYLAIFYLDGVIRAKSPTDKAVNAPFLIPNGSLAPPITGLVLDRIPGLGDDAPYRHILASLQFVHPTFTS